MSVSVTMPRLGESVTEGTVTRWLKSEGDHVDADEPLLEVSTDKVDTEVPSPASGTLTSIKVQEDETVDIGVELAVIGDDGASASAAAPAPAEPAAAPPASQQAAPAQSQPVPVAEVPAPAPPYQPAQYQPAQYQPAQYQPPSPRSTCPTGTAICTATAVRAAAGPPCSRAVRTGAAPSHTRTAAAGRARAHPAPSRRRLRPPRSVTHLCPHRLSMRLTTTIWPGRT